MIKRSSLTYLALILIAGLLTGCSKPDLYDSEGKGVRFKDDSGKWLVMNIWAEWCEPCRDEIPELNELFHSGNVRVVGFDFDNSQGEELKKKIRSLGIQFPVVASNPLPLLETKMPAVLPATLIMNPEGKLVEVLYGPQTKAGLKEKVKELQMKKDGADG